MLDSEFELKKKELEGSEVLLGNMILLQRSHPLLEFKLRVVFIFCFSFVLPFY